MKLSATPRYKRAYKSLTSEQKKATNDALRKFEKDSRHPGLHFERLKGSDYRTIRVDLGMRIVLRGNGTDFELIDVDNHKAVDRKYG